MGSVLSTCTWRGRRTIGQDSDTDDEGAHCVIPWHSDSDSAFSLSTKQEEVKRRLQCPICFDICIPPIFQCDTGHHICEKCKSRLKKCPYCTSEYHGTRNYFLENYFEKNSYFSFPCPSAKDGCKEIVTGKNFKDHYENCPFRPLLCVSCLHEDKYVPMSEYLDHLVKIHRAIYWDGQGQGQGQDEEFMIHMSWPPHCRSQPGTEANAIAPAFCIPRHLFKFCGFTFLLINTILGFTMGSWVKIFGNQNEANQFHAQLSIDATSNGTNVTKSSMSWEGPVLPIRYSEESIMDESKCMLNSIDYIKSICGPTPGKEAGFGWTIKCKLIKKVTTAKAGAK